MKAYKLWFRLVKRFGLLNDVTATQVVELFQEFAFDGMTDYDRNRLKELMEYKIESTLPVNDPVASIKNGERDKLRQSIVGDKLQVDGTTTIDDSILPLDKVTLFSITSKKEQH